MVSVGEITRDVGCRGTGLVVFLLRFGRPNVVATVVSPNDQSINLVFPSDHPINLIIIQGFVYVLMFNSFAIIVFRLNRDLRWN